MPIDERNLLNPRLRNVAKAFDTKMGEKPTIEKIAEAIVLLTKEVADLKAVGSIDLNE